LGQGITRHLKAKIGNNCVIGQRTSVDSESKIINSVLGKDCKIGKGVVIENCIIWDNVEVKDNC